MMNRNKLLVRICTLACIAVCFVLLFTACAENGIRKDPTEPSETEEVTQAEETEGKDTTPEETEPEATEPTETEPTEPEPTEPEPTETEPEETQPSSGGNNMNTGTGGGYAPGTSDPTEPEATEPPVIEVPAAGSENNAYTEQISNTSGSFKTVKIPAGETMHYKLKTPGTYLLVEDGNVSVTYGGQTYTPENGVVKIELPADDSQYIALSFTNQAEEETAFAVRVQDALGTIENPVMLDSVAAITAECAEGDNDGIYYKWIADKTGSLKLNLQEIAPDGEAVEVIVTVNGESCQLAEGSLIVDVQEGQEVLIQVLAVADENGNMPAVTATVDGYVAQRVSLKVTSLPKDVESVSIPAGQSAFYDITIANNKVMTIANEDVAVVCNGICYTADENGLVTVFLGASPVSVEIYNDSQEETTYNLSFSHPLGHQKNPHVLTQLGEIPMTVRAGENAYYLNYTAEKAGVVSFQIWSYPETEFAKADIILLNETTGESEAIWRSGTGGLLEDMGIASVSVKAGDVLTIQVYVEDENGATMDAALMVYGDLYGSEELPINVQYPGFKAHVPAGETLYYQAYNMSGMILNLTASNVKISHNGAEFTPESEKISFVMTAEGRAPAIFAITNTGTADAVYQVSFAYPVGHMENPDKLILGTNTVTREAGDQNYYYSFTAVRAGTLTLSFDGNAQWLYTVDNMTQGIYGDTQWSDSDPLMAEMTITVAKGDVIRVQVNTYDAANMFETPAGTVTFTAKYVTGPIAIESLTVNTNVNLIPGEYGTYTGQFYDYVLYVAAGKDMVVIYDGVEYTPDSKGEIYVPFPESDGSGNQPDLMFTVYNAGTQNMVRSMMFSGKQMGSKDNPEVIGMGSHTMTQTQANGADYYYVYHATARGSLTITITSSSNWVYQVTNLATGATSNIRLSSISGQQTFRITVRPGQDIEIMVNTFDPKTGESIEGTVEFTVTQ